MTAVPRVSLPPVAEVDTEVRRRVIVRGARIALWVWPAFTALDAYMCFVAYPGAPFLLFMGYRIIVELYWFGVLAASRRTTVGVETLQRALNAGMALCALAIALMAIPLGGIRSPYMHGISVVALVRAAVVPDRWQRAWPTFARIGLAFPLVIAGVAVVSPDAWASWVNAESLIVFGSNYVFVVASSILGLISGHIVWRAEEQVYRARRLGRYRLQAPIAKGGMGEVWLAWDLSLRRNVALKLLRVGKTVEAQAVSRFEREALVASRLQGPHVVRIFDFGASDDGLYYIAMEYLNGCDLHTLVEQHGPVPPARAIHMVLQACEALQEAHAAGIIHRDIKPHNLFVTPAGSEPDFVKLLDFGVVRVRLDAAEQPLTWTGAVVGTPAFIAPEVWQGARADERSDLYSLGLTLHYLVTGTTLPYATPFGYMVRPDPEATPAQDVRTVPESLAAVIRACLAPVPDARIQTVAALHRSLSDIHRPEEWTRDRATEFWQRVGTALPAPASAS